MQMELEGRKCRCSSPIFLKGKLYERRVATQERPPSMSSLTHTNVKTIQNRQTTGKRCKINLKKSTGQQSESWELRGFSTKHRITRIMREETEVGQVHYQDHRQLTGCAWNNNKPPHTEWLKSRCLNREQPRWGQWANQQDREVQWAAEQWATEQHVHVSKNQ